MRHIQEKIISELGARPSVDPAYEIESRTAFLESYLARSGMRGYVLGISGGQDSLLAGILAERAVRRRRDAGHEATFHAVLLPYGEQRDRADALLALEVIQPDVTHDIDIRAATDAFATTYAEAEHHPLPDFDKGNVKARMRMIAQYAIAGPQKLLVIGTDHAAEAITGFYTKYGDGGADILPLSGLNKRQGRMLLKELNAPEVFISKQPTADLLDVRPGQPDETELGISYDTLDDYLEGKPIEQAAAMALEARFVATAHKRAMPVSFDVQTKH